MTPASVRADGECICILAALQLLFRDDPLRMPQLGTRGEAAIHGLWRWRLSPVEPRLQDGSFATSVRLEASRHGCGESCCRYCAEGGGGSPAGPM